MPSGAPHGSAVSILESLKQRRRICGLSLFSHLARTKTMPREPLPRGHQCSGSGYGIRTRVSALRGRYPGPLDESATHVNEIIRTGDVCVKSRWGCCQDADAAACSKCGVWGASPACAIIASDRGKHRPRSAAVPADCRLARLRGERRRLVARYHDTAPSLS